MNLHEYQGKEILAKHGVRVQRGYVAETVSQAIKNGELLSKETNTPFFLVKAQIHAGGRGKGGGIKLAKNMTELKEYASSILGMMLITPQTSNKGKKVNKEGLKNKDIKKIKLNKWRKKLNRKRED